MPSLALPGLVVSSRDGSFVGRRRVIVFSLTRAVRASNLKWRAASKFPLFLEAPEILRLIWDRCLHLHA